MTLVTTISIVPLLRGGAFHVAGMKRHLDNRHAYGAQIDNRSGYAFRRLATFR